MTRVAVIGKDMKKMKKFCSDLKKKGFMYSDEHPDLVLCFGGDGMFFIAERVFPHCPKVLIKDSVIGNKATTLSVEEILQRYSEGNYKTEELPKLKAVARGRFEYRSLLGVNDIVIRNRLPTEAVRFRYKVNGGPWSEKIVGDGVIIATPYGSGGYFSSVTRKTFTKGIGMAFNNPFMVKRKPEFLQGTARISLEILRGEAVLVADNNRDFINLKRGSRVVVRLSKQHVKRLVF